MKSCEDVIQRGKFSFSSLTFTRGLCLLTQQDSFEINFSPAESHLQTYDKYVKQVINAITKWLYYNELKNMNRAIYFSKLKLLNHRLFETMKNFFITAKVQINTFSFYFFSLVQAGDSM